MRKLFLLILSVILLVSCGDEPEFNMPSIQGEVNTIFYRATNASATLNGDGSVTLIGNNDEGKVTLKIAEYATGVYTLGENLNSSASFTTFENQNYYTDTEGEGTINVMKIENGELFGDFYFNALNEGVGDTLNFSKGSFFGVPLTNPSPPTGPSQACAEAQLTTQAAEMAYDNADPNDPNDQALKCNLYKAALEDQIEECGDEDGSLQAEYDNLGDCTF